MIAVSACLAGVCCRYDGNSNENEYIVELVRKKEAILICPEQLGGLATPRYPCEIVNKEETPKVINSEGEDKTKEFTKGAEEALKICKLYGVKKAILKAKSPSCGFWKVYDGNFQRKLINGIGITAKLFIENGIEVVDETTY